ncbi:MAG TPA: membrane protein insertase YidC [Candidatus Angelobacter sp.]|nr:membrane protein insertase YidC [Candidatus Angelobacter sp.]
MTEYYDPKNEPGGEKKLLLAFLLVFVGIAIMQYLAPKPAAPPAQPKPAPQLEQPSPTPSAAPSAVATTPAKAAKPEKKGAPASPTVPVKQAASETETVIENANYRIVFTNRGAVVKSWILKKYRNDKHEDLDLVNRVTAPVLGYPLSLFSYDQALQKKLNEAMYVPSVVGTQSAPTEISFVYADGQTTARKTFQFDSQSYVVSVESEVSDNGKSAAAFPQWPGGFGDETVLSSYGGSRVDWEQDGKITRKPPQSGWFLTGKSWVVGGQTINGPLEWVATVDQYFAAVFMPDAPKDAALVTFHTQVEIPRNLDKPEQEGKDKAPVLGVAVGGVNGVTRERLFVGPKDVEVLESVQAQPNGPDLHGILDFGWFGVISRPLFAWLKWTYRHWIPNWGWAIAFLTVVINAALLPLRISSMKSSLKMQKIQPQVKAITEKYKRYGLTDPRRAQMQQEMSALYKREGVNPVGGCFPMLLQMPFLFAFYSMLGNAIELRQAGWLWIHDLSAADPLHILPILIVISMFLSSKSMPQGGMDPAQQKMMQLITPLMLGLISWNLAAGLGIYWAISNLLMWVQQIAINRTEFGQQVRKTVEKRAARKR